MSEDVEFTGERRRRHCEPVTPQWRGFYKKKHGCFVIGYHFIADYIKPYFSISYQKCFLGGTKQSGVCENSRGGEIASYLAMTAAIVVGESVTVTNVPAFSPTKFFSWQGN